MPDTPPKAPDVPKYEDGSTYWVTGKMLNAIWKAIQMYRPLAGRNLKASQKDDGIILDADGGGSGSGDHPWQVTVDAGQAVVALHSILFRSAGYLDRAIVSGLGVPIDVGTSDRVWLQIDFTDWPDSYTATIHTLAAGGDWGDGEVEDDGATPAEQTIARIVLATISDGVVTPLVFTHLTMRQYNDGGLIVNNPRP